MNSEELEQSLRTEFETYLNDITSVMRTNVKEFQNNFEAEFEKYKQQMDESFRGLNEKLDSAPEFDDVFKQTVIEHLRLSRDEGAQLAATAFGEAEKLKEQTTTTVNYDQISNAVKAIKAETSQAAILKVLLQHASNFAPRGALFIVKGDQIAGWRSLGSGSENDDQGLTAVRLPLDSDNLVSRAAVSMETTDGAYGLNNADTNLSDALNYGRPDRMYAVPLIARGRGVAVLYADYGEGSSLNIEALETLVSVAGLTVELLAANQATRGQVAGISAYAPPEDQFNRTNPDLKVEDRSYTQPPVTESFESEVEFESAVEVDNADTGFAFTPSTPVEETNEVVEDHASFESAYDDSEYAGSVAVSEPEAEIDPIAAYEIATENESVQTAEFEAVVEPESETENVYEPVPVSVGEVGAEEGYANSGYDFETGSGYQTSYAETGSAETIQNETRPESNDVYPSATSFSNSMPASAESPTSERPRVGRGLDLPIEVTEDERKSHTKARRFARLLVSEIKLYNEQKVAEGRQSGDLFDRLREAIERSREMYNKRVESDVAARFDYFDYELVTDLAEGDVNKLGSSYPGSNVSH